MPKFSPRPATTLVSAPPAPVAVAPAPAVNPGAHLATARAAQMADPNSYINSIKFTPAKLREVATELGYMGDPTWASYLGAFFDKLDELNREHAAKKGAAQAAPAAGPAKRGRKPTAPAAAAAPVLPAPQVPRAPAAPATRPTLRIGRAA